MRAQVINKEDFIRKLQEEAALTSSDIAYIISNWNWYVAAAETILPEIPELGFLSSRKKKLSVYDEVVTLVNEYRLNETTGVDKLQILQLVIEYSSNSFSRASNAYLNQKVEKKLHQNTSNLKNILVIIASLTLWIVLVELLNGSVSSIINYYHHEYEGIASGVILRSELKHGAKGGVHYDISYSYIVDENSYFIGNKVNFYKNSGDVAEDAVSNYPTGKQITVYYDKNSPNHSVLEITDLGGGVWFDIFGILLLTTASYYVFRT